MVLFPKINYCNNTTVQITKVFLVTMVMLVKESFGITIPAYIQYVS